MANKANAANTIAPYVAFDKNSARKYIETARKSQQGAAIAVKDAVVYCVGRMLQYGSSESAKELGELYDISQKFQRDILGLCNAINAVEVPSGTMIADKAMCIGRNKETGFFVKPKRIVARAFILTGNIDAIDGSGAVSIGDAKNEEMAIQAIAKLWDEVTSGNLKKDKEEDNGTLSASEFILPKIARLITSIGKEFSANDPLAKDVFDDLNKIKNRLEKRGMTGIVAAPGDKAIKPQEEQANAA